MHREAKELYVFLKTIHENPRDVGTRGVFADWLEEHDEPELAAEQREFNLKKHEAEVWMREFCKKYEADYDDFLQACKSGEGYSFGSTDGPWAVRDYQEELWENVQILTETTLDENHRENTYFNCGC